MLTTTLRGLPLLLLGAAGSTAITGLGVGVLLTATSAHGVTRWVSVALGLLGLIAVIAALSAPPVRPVAASMGRSLLGVDLPPVGESRDRAGRVNALLWCLIVLAVGAVCVFVVLVLVPAAAGLGQMVFTGGSVRVLGRARRIEAGDLFWLPVVVVLLVLAAVVPSVGVHLLRAATPRWLGPTDGDRLILERERSRELARRNRVAADLHDTIGHALTAIGVQADAGATVVAQDAQFAAGAFAAIRDTANSAVHELDSVIARLRDGEASGAEPMPVDASIRAIAAGFPADRVRWVQRGVGEDLPAGVRSALLGVLREAVTNGVRHGAGPVEVTIEVGDGHVWLRVVNAVGPSPEFPVAPRSGHGLSGMAERVHAVSGTLEAGPDGPDWVLTVVVPVHR